MEATIGFKPGVWQKEINVSDFIRNNYTEYTGLETITQNILETKAS